MHNSTNPTLTLHLNPLSLIKLSCNPSQKHASTNLHRLPDNGHAVVFALHEDLLELLRLAGRPLAQGHAENHEHYATNSRHPQDVEQKSYRHYNLHPREMITSIVLSLTYSLVEKEATV